MVDKTMDIKAATVTAVTKSLIQKPETNPNDKAIKLNSDSCVMLALTEKATFPESPLQRQLNSETINLITNVKTTIPETSNQSISPAPISKPNNTKNSVRKISLKVLILLT